MRVSQSTSSCSLRVVRFPPKIAAAPSTAPVVEKDQQEPHLPWFFTSDTAPRSTQSTDLRPTALRSPGTKAAAEEALAGRTPRLLGWVPSRVARNSSRVRSAREFRPMEYPRALAASVFSLTRRRLALKAENLSRASFPVACALP